MQTELQYTVLINRVPEGGYIASVPFLPGCMTQGETFEEVQGNIREAISGYISVLKEDEDDIPVENPDRIATVVSVNSPV